MFILLAVEMLTGIGRQLSSAKAMSLMIKAQQKEVNHVMNAASDVLLGSS